MKPVTVMVCYDYSEILKNKGCKVHPPVNSKELITLIYDVTKEDF